MIKKTIKFKDFNEEDQTEDFYFNLTKGELVEMELRATSSKYLGMVDLIEKISSERDGNRLADLFKDMVGRSFGVKSVDGKRFIKNAENLAEFESTGAYGELIFELATNAGAATEFVNGLMPANLAAEVKKEVETTLTARQQSEANMQGFQQKQEAPKATVQSVPDLPAEPAPTEDLRALSHEQLIARLQAK